MKENVAKINLLIVDDEKDLTTSLKKTLSRRGIHVIIANNGNEALTLLHEFEVDAVLLDIKMPGMDGEDVYTYIKRLWPGLPVVILTGHGDIDQAFRMTKGGVAEYLTKPFDLEELLKAIKSKIPFNDKVNGYQNDYFD